MPGNIKENNNFISGDLVKVKDDVSYITLAFNVSLDGFNFKTKTSKGASLKIYPGEIGIIVDIKREGSLQEFLLFFNGKIGWTSNIYSIEKISGKNAYK